MLSIAVSSSLGLPVRQLILVSTDPTSSHVSALRTPSYSPTARGIFFAPEMDCGRAALMIACGWACNNKYVFARDESREGQEANKRPLLRVTGSSQVGSFLEIHRHVCTQTRTLCTFPERSRHICRPYATKQAHHGRQRDGL